MKRTISMALAMLVGLMTGCAAVPKMEQQEASGIAIAIKIKLPLGWPTGNPEKVYFVRLDDKGDILQNMIIPSIPPNRNDKGEIYAKDGRIYLLNVAPGDYAAVAARYINNQSAVIVFFPKDLIELTRVSVRKGQIVCAGSYVLSTSIFGDRDTAQRHYESVMRIGLLSPASWRGSLQEAKNDDNAKGECIRRAKEDLAEGGWHTLIK